ncbi:MAG: DNRLRE domain-containing protein [Chitinophagaceae bacterium]|nr:DNRLRE domain-containing protein [Chitinophagaceae bacterium]
MKLSAYPVKKLLFSCFTTLLLTTVGHSQTGLQFNGTNQYVTFGAATNTLGTSTFTLEAWVKKTGTGVTANTGTGGIDAIPVITKGRGEAETPANLNCNYFLGINTSGKLVADFEDKATGLNHPITGVTTLSDNIWYHIAATYDGTTWRLYINGVQDAFFVVGVFLPENTSIQHAGLGTAMNSTGVAAGFFAGVIDEARIWNFARSQVQISASMNSELTSGTGLLGRWGLNDGLGTTAVNSIGGSPNGTLTNGPTWVCGAPALDFTPTAPSVLTASAPSVLQVNLGWTDNSNNETGFEIERSTTGIAGTYTLLATVSPNVTTYSDLTVYASTEYCYRVRAKNCTINSGYAGPTCATTPAEGANALQLTPNTYVTFGAAPSLASQNFTVEAWFKRTAAGTAVSSGSGGIVLVPIVAKGSPEADGSTVDANYILGISSANKIAADFEEGTGSASPGLNHPVEGTTTIINNVWYHAAATYESGIFSLYLNGILEGTLNLGVTIWPQGASIQHSAMGTMLNSTGVATGFFAGVIDEARIWNYERAEAQIQSTINSQITTPQTGLLARWGLNDGTGTIVHANAGTTVNGTITGAGYSWVTPGAPFNISFTPPIAPTSLGVSTISSTVLQLNWTDNSTDETGFQIERSTTGAGGPFSLFTTVGANIVTYNNTGLSPSTNYCYRVRAINGGLSSSYSNTGCGTTMSSGPVTVSFQDGVNGYTGTRDTYTWETLPSTPRGNEITFIQDLNTSDERRSLLRFDLSSIPSGVTISSAQLQFYVDVEGEGFNMHRMLVPWNESTVTYASIGNRHFAPDNIDAQSSVNANWPGNALYTGLITVSVPASTIQDWINGTLPNNGWLMIATDPLPDGNGQQLRSRENTTSTPDVDHPKLTVTYSTSPPNQPTSPSPANNANAPSTSPNICATVSDPDAGNLTVRYYGRKKVNANSKLTIIGLPDTQFYTEEVPGTNSGGGGHNGIFKSQTQWIKDHRIDSSIAFVVQLGDCVQNGDNPPGADKQIEWKRADTSMKIIENPSVSITDGIPYGICVGNHDQGTIGDPNSTNTYYNQYFGETRFTGRGYYGGHYSTNNDNHYELFSGGGVDFIHISIEYYPNGTTPSLQPVLDWADALLKAYPNRKGILSSHNILGTSNPANFQGPGQKIYDDLKDNPNLILMLAGHVAGEGRRTDVFGGNTIHTLMADYQSGYTNGGNGYLRIMQFLPAQNLLSVKTYSPYSNTSFTGSGSQFTLPVNLTQPFTLLGTNTNVASGSQTCINWPSLEQLTDYEWYVEVSDGVSTTTGPVWTFTTPANSPLPVNLVSFKAIAENNSKVKITWTTSYERDNSHFEVQRSKDGINFLSIGTIPGMNNSNSLHDYNFYDNLPFKGVSFYRLKQVDIDARLSYSRIERVNITDTKNSFDVYPNPSTGNAFNITLLKDIRGVIEINVYDMKGSLQLQQQFSGANTITINHHLSPGVYTIRLTGDRLNEIKQLAIQ